MPHLKNFEQQQDHVFIISKLEHLEYWKNFGLLKRAGALAQCGPVPL
jgi:hypothetical protein